MKPLRKNPHLYEINLMTWLYELSLREGRPITLGNIPSREWETFEKRGMDLVWLMGVWQRSPDSKDRAGKEPALVESCRSILRDFSADDIVGSPYAVYDYEPHAAFGTGDDLIALKKQLEDRGLGLVLDFVPNHTACDHPWVKACPERFIHAGPKANGRCEDGFFFAANASGKPCIAHGKDPYFPPWTDTAQLDYCNAQTTRAMAETLHSISRCGHGFRCDMAMLVLKDVFRKTWENYTKHDVDSEEFWSLAGARLKSAGRPIIRIAEAYWGMEEALFNVGFDYVYDKGLYDLMVEGDIQGLKSYLARPVDRQERMVRFLENHDEPRAWKTFGPARVRSAMVIQATLPGMRFWHHGQLEGREIKLPVQLRREPVHPPNMDLVRFSEDLLREVDHPVFHDGRWALCDTKGWADNPSHERLLAWCWLLGEHRRLVVVNFTSTPAQGCVTLPSNWMPAEERVLCKDPIKGDTFVRASAKMEEAGLYVGLEAWDFHFLRMEKM